MNFPNNAPGLYLAPENNNLVVVMNTFKEIEEKIIVKNSLKKMSTETAKKILLKQMKK